MDSANFSSQPRRAIILCGLAGKELSRIERLPMARLLSVTFLPPSVSLVLSYLFMRDPFTMEYTRQPASCASIQTADMCRINYISVNGLSGELVWTGSRGPRVSNHSGPLFLVLCAGRQASQIPRLPVQGIVQLIRSKAVWCCASAHSHRKKTRKQLMAAQPSGLRRIFQPPASTVMRLLGWLPSS